MAFDGDFKVIKELGAIVLGETSEIRFSVNEFNGRTYGSIRKYLKHDNYTGPTRAGITVTADIVSGILSSLKSVPPVSTLKEGIDLGKFAKRKGLSVVARVSLYQGIYGIDLREWQEDISYTGWTKKSIRIPFGELAKIEELFCEMLKELRLRESE